MTYNPRKGQEETDDEPGKTDQSGIELQSPNDQRQLPIPKNIRKKEFGFIPIPKSKRHDPNLKVHEQFIFTWKINLILAGAAVSVMATIRLKLMVRLYPYLIYTTPRYVFCIITHADK